MSMASGNSNQVDECIKKIFAPEKVFTLQFICMDTIIRNNEEQIKHDLLRTRSEFNLENSHLNFRETKLWDLITRFYSGRRLPFTPFVYLFMINRKEDLIPLQDTDYDVLTVEEVEEWFNYLLEKHPERMFCHYYQESADFKQQYANYFISYLLQKGGVYHFL